MRKHLQKASATLLLLGACGETKYLPVTRETLPQHLPVQSDTTYFSACTPYRQTGGSGCNRFIYAVENNRVYVVDAVPSFNTNADPNKKDKCTLPAKTQDALILLADAVKVAHRTWPQMRDHIEPTLHDDDNDGTFDMYSDIHHRYVPSGSSKKEATTLTPEQTRALNKVFRASREASLLIGEQAYPVYFAK